MKPLKLREHADYYWGVKQVGQWQLAVCEQVPCKHLRVQTPEYRHRNHEFLNTMRDLSGLNELHILPRPIGSAPQTGTVCKSKG